MELEDEMRRKIVLSVVVVVFFIVLIVGVGATYTTGGGLGSTGGLALVASIVLFILAMAGVGVYLSR